MNIEELRKSFVAKVSWGPTKISFGDAISAFDLAVSEQVVTPQLVLDSNTLIGSVDASISTPGPVKEYTPPVRQKKRVSVEEETGMVLEAEQENAEALKKNGS